MDRNQIDQLMITYGDKLPVSAYQMICSRLEQMDWQTANMAFMQMKDPTIALILSIIIGSWGIDRIYVGDMGLGILKLITCGGCGVWWLVDLFLIMERTKEKNAMRLTGLM